MDKQQFGIIALMVFIAAFTRIIPHPPNVTPLIAMALLSGVYVRPRYLALSVPILAMVLSDLVLSLMHGYDFLTPMRAVIYSCFIVISLVGEKLHTYKSARNIFLTALGSSVFFFVVTNFAVWVFGKLYPETFSGLLLCYTAALPFFRIEIIGTIVYTAILFGGYEGILNRFMPNRVTEPV